MSRTGVGLVLVSLFGGFLLQAQQSGSQNVMPENASAQGASPEAATVVPRLVQFSGVLTDAAQRVATGSVALTFSFYQFPERAAATGWSGRAAACASIGRALRAEGVGCRHARRQACFGVRHGNRSKRERCFIRVSCGDEDYRHRSAPKRIGPAFGRRIRNHQLHSDLDEWNQPRKLGFFSDRRQSRRKHEDACDPA